MDFQRSCLGLECRDALSLLCMRSYLLKDTGQEDEVLKLGQLKDLQEVIQGLCIWDDVVGGIS